jgi:hypothetical protein
VNFEDVARETGAVIRKDYARGTRCGAVGRAGFALDVGLAYLPSRIFVAALDGTNQGKDCWFQGPRLEKRDRCD